MHDPSQSLLVYEHSASPQLGRMVSMAVTPPVFNRDLLNGYIRADSNVALDVVEIGKDADRALFQKTHLSGLHAALVHEATPSSVPSGKTGGAMLLLWQSIANVLQGGAGSPFCETLPHPRPSWRQKTTESRSLV